MTEKIFRSAATRLLMCVVLTSGFVYGAATLASAGTAGSVPNKVDLRVLVLSDGSPNVTAIQTQLAREGVPATVVDTTSATRPTIDDAYLADATAHEGRFQGIVLSGPGAVSAGEMAAIGRYERTYGVREIDAYVYPNAAVGMTTPTFAGTLDGSAITVTSAAKSAGFGYLAGHLTIDNFSSTVPEVYGYLATGQDPQPAGDSYTPFMRVTLGATTGSIVGVYRTDGREQLVITAAFDAYQQYFEELGPGLVTWLTRGIYLGFQRNYFSVEVDDVLMADSQWSTQGHCTPGDDCYGAEAGLTTPDIRMQAADVAHLVDWQSAHGFHLDLVFNGGGSDDAISESGGPDDPLLVAFQANVGAFGWINHTYSHEYLGCIQVAPPVAGELWHCATPTDYADPATVFVEPDLAQGHAQYDPASGFYFLTLAEIDDQISRNLAWAQQHGIPTNPAELVTGEHSGLAILPQQPMDSPHLVQALTDEHITALAADASREPLSRTVGSAQTVPRHPMNIFYNVDTYLGEVSEYNWYYTSRADGGSGVCEAQPQVTTCIPPLADATEADAQASFTGYIVPTETRNALSFILSNDPRPFYVHQSNLTGQRILFPVLNRILSQYRSVYDAATTPLVSLDLIGQAQQLTRMSQWTAAADGVHAYVDATGVHISGGSGVAVPLTVPAGAALAGVSLSPYGGAQSGWIQPPADGGAVAVPAAPSGGYVGVPDPPIIGTATAGHASAQVTWSPAPDNGSPVTGYLVRAYLAGNVTPAVTVVAAAGATGAVVTGLLNYASYTFTVSATSAVGTSDESALSNAVIPVPSVPGPPTIGNPVAGNQSATISWTAPTDDGGSPVTLYTVRLYTTGAATASSSQDVPPGTTTATFTGLTNGTAYTFDVFAYNAAGPGAPSARSAPVTPQGTVPSAVRITAAIGGSPGGAVTATVWWSPPASSGGAPILGYVVTARLLGASGGVQGTIVLPAVPGAVRSLPMALPAGSYSFTVQAVNRYGAGDPSLATAVVIAR